MNKIHADLLSSKADISKAVSPKLKLSAWLDAAKGLTEKYVFSDPLTLCD